MKTTITIVLLLTGWLSAVGAPIPSLEERIANADVIAVISVTNVTKTIVTNAAGSQVTIFVAEAVVDRTLKGTPPRAVRVKDATTGTMFSADDLYRPADAPLRAHTWALGTRRFLVFLKPSGDAYMLSAPDSLTAVYGSDSSSARIAGAWWPCITLDEAIASVEKRQ